MSARPVVPTRANGPDGRIGDASERSCALDVRRRATGSVASRGRRRAVRRCSPRRRCPCRRDLGVGTRGPWRRHQTALDDARPGPRAPRRARAAGARRAGAAALTVGDRGGWGRGRRGHHAALQAGHGHRSVAGEGLLAVFPARQHRGAAPPGQGARRRRSRRPRPAAPAHGTARPLRRRGRARPRGGAGRAGPHRTATGVHSAPHRVLPPVGARDRAARGHRPGSGRVRRGARSPRRPALADRRAAPRQAHRRRRGPGDRLVHGAARPHGRARAARRVRARGARGRFHRASGGASARAGLLGRVATATGTPTSLRP